MKARFETSYGSQIQGKKIKEQGAVGFRSQGNHFALLVLPGVVVDPLQVGGFSSETWTVVHQLAINFARRKIDERHFVVDQNAATNLAYAVQAGQHSRAGSPSLTAVFTVSTILAQSPCSILLRAAVR